MPYGTVGGQSAIGAGAAARLYFNKRVQDLTLREAAMLAGMPQAPSPYSPVLNPSGTKERRNEVLGKMAELGYITREKAQTEMKKGLGLHMERYFQKARERYVLDYVQSELIKEYGRKNVQRGGFKVYTTIDLKKQHEARAAIADKLGSVGPSSAIVSIDPKNGDIVAMASSQAVRQVEVQPRRPGPPPARLVVQDDGAADRAARGREPELDAATSRAARWSSTTRRAARPAQPVEDQDLQRHRARQHQPRHARRWPPTTPSTRS